MRTSPGISARPALYTPGLVAVVDALHVMDAATDVPSSSRRGVSGMPVGEAAPEAAFQLAAGLSPATSVKAIGFGVIALPPAPPTEVTTPPTKSTLRILRT